MKNKIILAVLVIVFGFSFVIEPVQDSIDLLAGATSDTYGVPDDYAAASDGEHEHDDDADEHEEEEEDDD